MPGGPGRGVVFNLIEGFHRLKPGLFIGNGEIIQLILGIFDRPGVVCDGLKRLDPGGFCVGV